MSLFNLFLQLPYIFNIYTFKKINRVRKISMPVEKNKSNLCLTRNTRFQKMYNAYRVQNFNRLLWIIINNNVVWDIILRVTSVFTISVIYPHTYIYTHDSLLIIIIQEIRLIFNVRSKIRLFALPYKRCRSVFYKINCVRIAYTTIVILCLDTCVRFFFFLLLFFVNSFKCRNAARNVLIWPNCFRFFFFF